MPMPEPRRASKEAHLDTAWLDLMEFRADYLRSAMTAEIDVQERFAGEVGLLYSHGDCSATQAVNTAALVAGCPRPSGLVLHMTNAHSIADIKYTAAIAQHYGVRGRLVENDGNRFGRTEIAKITLNCLLSGGTGFNFSSFSHFLDATEQKTDSARALMGAVVLKAHDDAPGASPSRFSTATPRALCGRPATRTGTWRGLMTAH